MKFKEHLKKCIQRTEKNSSHYLLAGLGDLLEEKQKIFVKEKLKEDILFLLKLYLKKHKLIHKGGGYFLFSYFLKL